MISWFSLLQFRVTHCFWMTLKLLNYLWTTTGKHFLLGPPGLFHLSLPPFPLCNTFNHVPESCCLCVSSPVRWHHAAACVTAIIHLHLSAHLHPSTFFPLKVAVSWVSFSHSVMFSCMSHVVLSWWQIK